MNSPERITQPRECEKISQTLKARSKEKRATISQGQDHKKPFPFESHSNKNNKPKKQMKKQTEQTAPATENQENKAPAITDEMIERYLAANPDKVEQMAKLQNEKRFAELKEKIETAKENLKTWKDEIKTVCAASGIINPFKTGKKSKAEKAAKE